MFRRLPAALSMAVLGLAALALPGAATALDHGAPTARAECAAETPAVKSLVAAAEGLKTALPDPAKTQVALGRLYDAIIGAQESGCLPPLPTSVQARAADPCLAPTVNLLSAVLGGVSATLATPPDAAAVTAAMNKLAEAVKAINDAKCLPVPLAVPGA
jgi:hypothetical protein